MFSYQDALTDYALEEIRSSVNHAWVLGNKKFKSQVEKETGRRVEPSQKGGDRKSEKYRTMKNQIH